MILPLAGVLDVLGIICGVMLVPGGVGTADLGAIATADGAPKRGLTSIVAGLAVAAAGVWLVR